MWHLFGTFSTSLCKSYPLHLTTLTSHSHPHSPPHHTLPHHTITLTSPHIHTLTLPTSPHLTSPHHHTHLTSHSHPHSPHLTTPSYPLTSQLIHSQCFHPFHWKPCVSCINDGARYTNIDLNSLRGWVSLTSFDCIHTNQKFTRFKRFSYLHH